MKTTMILLISLFFSLQCLPQKTAIHSSKFVNDIELVRPLINTNGTNGGYYREYWGNSFHYELCGTVLKNAGTAPATGVYLEIKLFDYYGYLQSYFSDTVATLAPGESATLNVPGEMTFEPYISTKLLVEYQFVAHATSGDENPSNNLYTVPFTLFTDWMWTVVSRSNQPNKSFEIGENSGFHSGDFIGFRLEGDEWHWAYNMGLFMYETCDSLVLRALWYRDGDFVDSNNVQLYPVSPSGDWVFSEPYYEPVISEGNWYIGIRFYFPQGKSFKIGIDTSVYHNFSSESIARVNNEWTSLPFVPVMTMVCDPEGITEKDPFKPVVFPNPAGERITVDNVRNSEVELFDFSGKILFSGSISSQTLEINVSGYAPGIYLLRIIRQDGVITRKVIVE